MPEYGVRMQNDGKHQATCYHCIMKKKPEAALPKDTLLKPKMSHMSRKSHVLSKIHVHQLSIDEVANNHRKVGSQYGALGFGKWALFKVLRSLTSRNPQPDMLLSSVPAFWYLKLA